MLTAGMQPNKACPYCGKENDSATVHCSGCGVPFAEHQVGQPKAPRQPLVRAGLCVVLLGLVIGGCAFQLPISAAKDHASRRIGVSLMTLLVASAAIVHGAALAWAGIERMKQNERMLWWISFFLAIVLCIALFQILDELGYPYR